MRAVLRSALPRILTFGPIALLTFLRDRKPTVSSLSRGEAGDGRRTLQHGEEAVARTEKTAPPNDGEVEYLTRILLSSRRAATRTHSPPGKKCRERAASRPVRRSSSR